MSTNAKVTGYVYGGCRSNGVTNNTLVLVEGGNHPATFFGGSDISGIVGGTSQVIVTAGSTGDVYGGGNGNYEYTGGVIPPYCNSTHVEALGGTCTNNVFGGGYAGECGETYVLVDGGTVTGSVYGGGNQAGVTIVDMNPDPEVTENTTGNSTIVMNGGSVGTGMYGGCNAQGNIAGNVAITLTGGTIGTEEHPADVHGGGYGQPTTVAGDVLINFGEVKYNDSNEEIHTDGPVLFGDLYGGSALGNVNTNSFTDPAVETSITIQIDNGTLHGNVYGGGLGDKESLGEGHTDVAAMVYGVVHVNVGRTDGAATPTFTGKASFDDTSIYGCNNLNGSPQDQVYVDVYQTNHTEKDMASYYVQNDRKYAIKEVFGGGNEADYTVTDKLTHVYVHGCENTIKFVYGGGNAADVYGVWLFVEGGRFDESYGGGNGLVTEANVGDGGIQHGWIGGRYSFTVVGSNKNGNTSGELHEIIPAEYPTGCIMNCLGPIIESWFNGANEAEIFGGLNCEIECGWSEGYKTNVYAGSRWAIIYGDINLTVLGGYIGNLFGGSKGYDQFSADIRKYPDADYDWNLNPNDYSDALKEYMIANGGLDGPLAGTGGNINIYIYGGTIGNLYGGCDANGNVEGKITIYVEDRGGDCPLFLGNVYGASNETRYKPKDGNSISPDVTIAKGTIGGDTKYGGFFDDYIHYEGNVFGGGNKGNVKASPKVHVGSSSTMPVTVKGSVYGGGNEGDVDGSPQVIIGPTE